MVHECILSLLACAFVLIVLPIREVQEGERLRFRRNLEAVGLTGSRQTDAKTSLHIYKLPPGQAFAVLVKSVLYLVENEDVLELQVSPSKPGNLFALLCPTTFLRYTTR